MFADFLQNITIKTAPVPIELGGTTARGVLWQASPGRFLLDLPEVARYLVEGGECVTIEPCTGILPDVVTHFARMTPLAALLYQRGMLAFHAAAVANERGAVLLAGDSGGGKSTLLMELLQRGWALLADELAIVSQDGNGGLHVIPTFSDIALWPDTLKKFGKEAEEFEHADANRLLLNLTDQRTVASQPLLAMYRLGVQSKAEISCERMAGIEHFKAVSTLLYNSHVADALLDRVIYMGYASAIVRTTPVVRLNRPRGSWSVDGLADLIEKELQ